MAKVYAKDLERALKALPDRPRRRYQQQVTYLPERAPVQDFLNPPRDAGVVHQLVWTFDGTGWSTEITF